MLFIRLVGICMLVAFTSTQLLATTAEELEKAANKGKTVFMLVTEPNASGNIAEQQQNIKAPAIDEKGTVIATVKCDGPMIIRPTSAAESED